MTTLVTGANGFLGKHIIEKLEKEYPNERFVSVQRSSSKPYEFKKDNWIVDLTAQHLVKSMMEHPKLQPIDRIIHCAGNAVVKIDDKNPSAHIQDNICMTNNLLYYAPQGCHFIFLSSITVYGDYILNPFVEDHPLRPTSIYSVSKIASEYLLSVYNKNKNIQPCIIRTSAVVGKHATHGVVFDFVRKLMSNNEHLDVIGNCPGSEKPYLHVDDFTDLMSLCVKNNTIGVYNATTDETLTSEQIANIVMDATGIKKEIRWNDNNWSGDNKVIKASANRAKSLGWIPKHDSANAVFHGAKDIYARLIKN